MPLTQNKTLITNWIDPAPEQLISPEFIAIWNCIKSWDIAVPKELDGSGLYSGATGNHVIAILNALKDCKK